MSERLREVAARVLEHLPAFVRRAIVAGSERPNLAADRAEEACRSLEGDGFHDLLRDLRDAVLAAEDRGDPSASVERAVRRNKDRRVRAITLALVECGYGTTVASRGPADVLRVFDREFLSDMDREFDAGEAGP